MVHRSYWVPCFMSQKYCIKRGKILWETAVTLSKPTCSGSAFSGLTASEPICSKPKAQDRDVLNNYPHPKRTHPMASHERPYWESNFDRNHRQSPIIRLPDELLVRILETLEIADLCMVRQISFIFWHIYLGKEFEKSHRREVRIWSRRSESFQDDEATVVRAKLNALCTKWRKRTTTLGGETRIFRCKVSYRKLVFSAEQRKKGPEIRQCIAHDAFIRSCPHLTVPVSWSWGKITHSERTSADRVRADRSVFGIFLEPKSCHQCEEITGFQDALHHRRDLRWIPKPPTISLYASPMIGNRQLSVLVTWELPLFTVVKDATITMDFIKQKLEGLRNKYGNIFFSHLGRHEITFQMLRVLDPQYCGCLGGDSRVGRLVPCDKAR
ncbi:hypothetical protein BDP55DRAFT_748245 [Colletotrichum godetiae]|uniref:F-box domain-containing protein n=1 Tax=Colletotrichum godetiae TaxID=1209918 RepID=A0AAJ0F1V8_9PEZI|nr:uncharacterized protein BDP55DRAFT_748245 [Colletotrichum godetiae]KAK1700064.1 hypothetical protein BDP55DRAFT_748245 [Colletotrichum godetiae]